VVKALTNYLSAFSAASSLRMHSVSFLTAQARSAALFKRKDADFSLVQGASSQAATTRRINRQASGAVERPCLVSFSGSGLVEAR